MKTQFLAPLVTFVFVISSHSSFAEQEHDFKIAHEESGSEAGRSDSAPPSKLQKKYENEPNTRIKRQMEIKERENKRVDQTLKQNPELHNHIKALSNDLDKTSQTIKDTENRIFKLREESRSLRASSKFLINELKLSNEKEDRIKEKLINLKKEMSRNGEQITEENALLDQSSQQKERLQKQLNSKIKELSNKAKAGFLSSDEILHIVFFGLQEPPAP